MATKQQPRSENEMNLGSFDEKPQPTKAGKKRVRKALKRIAAEKGISGPALGAESINLSGDRAKFAKQVDEKTVRQEFLAKAQANYEFIRKEFREFGKLCEEADIATSNRIAYFNARILNTDFYRRCQDIRDFFVTKSPQDYLIGEDGTKYFRAQDIFPAELGVTFQYVSRQMLKYRELYETLTGEKLPPKSHAGGRRTGSSGRSTGQGNSESPAGKVSLDELPEEARSKVLATMNNPAQPTEAAPTETKDTVEAVYYVIRRKTDGLYCGNHNWTDDIAYAMRTPFGTSRTDLAKHRDSAVRMHLKYREKAGHLKQVSQPVNAADLQVLLVAATYILEEVGVEAPTPTEPKPTEEKVNTPKAA
jgi:hypothetical protein